MNKILIVVLIGIVSFVAILLVPQFYVGEQFPLSRESCESFNGAWIEQKLECVHTELEECTKMRGVFEIRQGNLESFTVCK